MITEQIKNNALRNKLEKGMLGQILTDGEFISREDLQRALDEQLHTNEMLGDILVQMGILDPVDLKAALSISRELSSLEKAVKIAAGVRKSLGELLLQAKRITPQQLEQALNEQRQTGEKLGEVFVRLGFITKNELNAVLTFQEHQNKKIPGSLRIGELMVVTGHITRGQLEDSLTRQKLSKKKLGDILVEAGYVKPEQISHGLNLQEKLLTAALAAVLSLAPLSSAFSAGPSSYNLIAENNKTALAEEIKTLTALEVVFRTQELVITQADILRGYIDIPIAEKIVIQNNNLAGYLVFFKGLNGPFKEVIIKGLEKEITINSESGWITQPYNGRDPVTIELSYRFVFSDGAKPGTYAWPFTISVSPVIPV
jgi:hypothetical protein